MRRGTRFNVMVAVVLVPVTLKVCALSVESYWAGMGNECFVKDFSATELALLLNCNFRFFFV